MAINNLKEVLVKEGISQAKLAGEINVSSGTINKLANQKKTVSPTMEHKIVKGIAKMAGHEYIHKQIFPNS